MDNVGAEKYIIEIVVYDNAGNEVKCEEFTVQKEGNEDNVILTTGIKIPDLIYTGREQSVNPIVTHNGKKLEKGVDYTISGDSNVKEIGSYNITIQGIGAYTGSVSISYKVYCSHKNTNSNWKWVIDKKPTCTKEGKRHQECKVCGEIRNAEITSKSAHNYNGEKIKKKATAQKNGTLIKTCAVCGNKKSYVIYPAKYIGLDATNYIFNGKERKPKVYIKNSNNSKLKNGTDYTVSYAKGRKNVGQYAVTIKFKGKYSGTVKKLFTINPKPTGIKKLQGNSKSVFVQWKKQVRQVTGFEIACSLKKSFPKKETKIVTVKKSKTASGTISKLKAKKKYYVRIRTYKTAKVNGKTKKIYSNWSGIKSVKTKK